jgi:hypothetical protein
VDDQLKQLTMDDQLKQLFDYTKFHIGLYTTLLAAIIGVFANDTLKRSYSNYVPFMIGTVICFLVAGAAGGLVASSIPFYTRFSDFSQAWLGPWGWKWVQSITCTHIEHTAFWLGIVIAVVGLF